MPDRIALVGAVGFGRSHLEHLRGLHDAGLAKLVAVCDLAAPTPEVAAWLSERSIPWVAGFEQMLAETPADVVVVATPPHLHLGMLRAVFAAGCDALVEKPPVVTLSQFEEAEDAAAGHLCQVGFQALGSWALPRLLGLIESGELGHVDLVSAGGCWIRGDRYYGRAPWAGRRTLDGRPVNDGALTNAFGHAVNACLAVAGVDRLGGAPVETDLYQAHGIEGHDTGSVRVVVPGRPGVAVAVTLCAAEREDPWLVVRGDRGEARWVYVGDTIEVRDAAGTRTEHGPRTSLLDNLLAVRAGESPELLAPLSGTRSFVEVCDRILESPVQAVPPQAVRRWPSDGDHLTAIQGVEASTRRAAAEGLLYRETEADWLA